MAWHGDALSAVNLILSAMILVIGCWDYVTLIIATAMIGAPKE